MSGSSVRVLHPLYEAVDHLTTLGVGTRREVCVEGRGLDGLVAQIDLNLAQVHSGVQQMGGVRMAQGMHGGLLVNAGLLEGGPKGGLHALLGHRLRRGSGLISRAPQSRKEPERGAVGEPLLSQQFPEPARQRHKAIFAPFAEPDVQQHAGRVDIRDLDIEGLFEPQAAAVNQRQTGPIAEQPHAGKDLPDLLLCQDHRQAFLFGRAHDVQDLPFALQGALEETV